MDIGQIPNDQLIGKNPSLVYGWLDLVCESQLNMNSKSNMAHSGVTLKDMGKRNSSQWAVLWLIYLVTYFVWKKKVTQGWNIYGLTGCGMRPGRLVRGCGGI